MNQIKIAGSMHRDPIRLCSCALCDKWRPAAQKLVAAIQAGQMAHGESSDTKIKLPLYAVGENLFDAEHRLCGKALHNTGPLLCALVNDIAAHPRLS